MAESDMILVNGSWVDKNSPQGRSYLASLSMAPTQPGSDNPAQAAQPAQQQTSQSITLPPGTSAIDVIIGSQLALGRAAIDMARKVRSEREATTLSNGARITDAYQTNSGEIVYETNDPRKSGYENTIGFSNDSGLTAGDKAKLQAYIDSRPMNTPREIDDYAYNTTHPASTTPVSVMNDKGVYVPKDSMWDTTTTKAASTEITFTPTSDYVVPGNEPILKMTSASDIGVLNGMKYDAAIIGRGTRLDTDPVDQTSGRWIPAYDQSQTRIPNAWYDTQEKNLDYMGDISGYATFGDLFPTGFVSGKTGEEATIKAASMNYYKEQTNSQPGPDEYSTTQAGLLSGFITGAETSKSDSVSGKQWTLPEDQTTIMWGNKAAWVDPISLNTFKLIETAQEGLQYNTQALDVYNAAGIGGHGPLGMFGSVGRFIGTQALGFANMVPGTVMTVEATLQNPAGFNDELTRGRNVRPLYPVYDNNGNLDIVGSSGQVQGSNVANAGLAGLLTIGSIKITPDLAPTNMIIRDIPGTVGGKSETTMDISTGLWSKVIPRESRDTFLGTIDTAQAIDEAASTYGYRFERGGSFIKKTAGLGDDATSAANLGTVKGSIADDFMQARTVAGNEDSMYGGLSYTGQVWKSHPDTLYNAQTGTTKAMRTTSDIDYIIRAGKGDTPESVAIEGAAFYQNAGLKGVKAEGNTIVDETGTKLFDIHIENELDSRVVPSPFRMRTDEDIIWRSDVGGYANRETFAYGDIRKSNAVYSNTIMETLANSWWGKPVAEKLGLTPEAALHRTMKDYGDYIYNTQTFAAGLEDSVGPNPISTRLYGNVDRSLQGGQFVEGKWMSNREVFGKWIDEYSDTPPSFMPVRNDGYANSPIATDISTSISGISRNTARSAIQSSLIGIPSAFSPSSLIVDMPSISGIPSSNSGYSSISPLVSSMFSPSSGSLVSLSMSGMPSLSSSPGRSSVSSIESSLSSFSSISSVSGSSMSKSMMISPSVYFSSFSSMDNQDYGLDLRATGKGYENDIVNPFDFEMPDFTGTRKRRAKRRSKR